MTPAKAELIEAPERVRPIQMILETCGRCGARYPAGRLAACPRCAFEADLGPVVLGGVYELLEEIGRGGMGIVHKARDVRSGRIVAVKVLAADLAAQPGFQERFAREARALALLRHRNIVAFHELRQDEESYIVMEYVEGQPLSAQIPLPRPRALAVALQVCDALAYAHRHGLVHRDIKPENILLAHGRAMVSDFGIAGFAQGNPGGRTVATRSLLMGTPHYMAPEALAGAPADPRMDVYSLGVVLYEMVTGEHPVGIFELPGPPFERVLQRALAREPERRYATAEEMRRDLAPDAVTPTPGFGPSDRVWLWATALLMALVSGLALRVLRALWMPETGGFGVPPLPSLLALAAIGTAATALPWRRWRRPGRDQAQPEAPVAQADVVVRLGVLSIVVFGAREILDRGGHAEAVRYLRLSGGALELAALVFFWASIFEARRRSRSLWDEPYLWLGLMLALIPGGIDSLVSLIAWRP